MKVINLIGCILSVAAVIIGVYTVEHGYHQPPDGPYDFVIFIMKWARSYCNSRQQGCPNPTAKNYTIGGLLPMYEPGILVPPFNDTGCNTLVPQERLYMENLTEIVDNLDTYWPPTGLKRYYTNIENWEFNWNESGKCFSEPEDPKNFFKVAILMARVFDFLNILKNSKDGEIVPHNEDTYSRNQISQSINDFVGHQATIACIKDILKREQLYQIRVCYNKQGRLRSCPSPYASCHSEELIFPVA